MKRNSPPAGGLNRGFTFVELLVVVTIIAVLTAIGVANYSTVTKKSRDSRRKADLEQIRAALEIYRSDIGEYPEAGTGNGKLDMTTCDGSQTLKDSDGTNTYMNPIPCDPKTTGLYVYTPDGALPLTYELKATMEIDDDTGTCGSEGIYCVKQP